MNASGIASKASELGNNAKETLSSVGNIVKETGMNVG